MALNIQRDNSRRLFPLTSCSIGLWTPVEGMRPFLLLCPDRKQFVVLLAREPDTKARDSSAGSLSVNAVLACCRDYAAKWLRHKNPFIDHTQDPGSDTAVLTFEVAFTHVVGMDFRWPLTEEPRLVLEACHVTKRVFASVEEVCAYYPPVRHRRLQGGSATAATPGPAEQQLQVKQQQQQLNGSGPAAASPAAAAAAAAAEAAAESGTMSRAPSWASWASWTIGSTRTSLELASPRGTPGGQDGRAAAGPAGATASQPGAAANMPAAPAGPEDEPPNVLVQPAAVEQHQQQRQDPSTKCMCKSQPRSRSSRRSSGSKGCPACTLDSMVSLSVGIAGTAAQTAAAAAAAGAGADTHADECSSKPPQPLPAVQVNIRASGSSGADSTPSSEPGNNSRSPLTAGSDLQPLLLLPNGRQDTPGISPAPSSISSPRAAGAFSDSGAATQRSLLDGAVGEASFGFWQQPGQQEHSTGRFQGRRHGRAPVPRGSSTAPCSPRQRDTPHHLHGSSPSACSEVYGWELQQEQQGFVSPEQLHHCQQQQQHRARAGVRGSGGVSKHSARARSAAAESCCPLCHQTLIQPHAVLQQRYHQRQEHKHLRLTAGHSSSSKSGRQPAVFPRSRSACSLHQLQVLQQQERAGTDGGCLAGSSSSNNAAHDLQQQGSGDRSPLSPRALGGLAAAAFGALAARCRPGGTLSSSQHVSGVCTPDPMATAADGVLGAAAASSSKGGSGSPALMVGQAPAAANGGAGNPTAAAAASPDAAAHMCAADKAEAAAAAAAAVAGATTPAATPAATPTAAVGSSEGQTEAAAAGVGAGGGMGAGGSSPIVYGNRTVILTFTDPTLPYQLSKLVKNPEWLHLLKLYESGLPAWAVMLPSYGIWYRPWLRRVTWLLFVLLSVVSMAMGFYDLWKNVPYFKQVVVSMFRPAAAVFEWLEGHTQIRLSILLTYMVTKSQLLVQLVKLLADASLQPLLAPFAPLLTLASAAAEGVVWLLAPVVEAARLTFGPIGRLAWVLLTLLWRLLSTLLWVGPLQLLQALGGGVLSLGQLLLLPFRALLPAGNTLRAGWVAAKATGQVAKHTAPVVAGAARTAAGAVPWWWWSPFEALELMRVSSMRVIKALQAVLRAFAALAAGLNKHRLSMTLQLKGKLRGGLQAAAASPAGRVAVVVADQLGQGERLRRVTRSLHAQESLRSLNSMGSEALGSLVTFGPAVGEPYRPFARGFSPNGESEVLLETHERGESEEEEEEEEDGAEVSSSLRLQEPGGEQLHGGGGDVAAGGTPGWPLLSSSAGLRQRTTAAVAAAAAGVGAGAAEGGGVGGRAPAAAAAGLASSPLAVPGGRQQLSAHALRASSFHDARSSSSNYTSSSSRLSPVEAAAAAKAALLRRSVQLPSSGGSLGPSPLGAHSAEPASFRAAAPAATGTRAPLHALRQSYDSFRSHTAAVAAAAGQASVAAGSAPAPQEPWPDFGASSSSRGASLSPGLVDSYLLQQLAGLDGGAGEGGGAAGGAAVVSQAAGLLMLPVKKGRPQSRGGEGFDGAAATAGRMQLGL